MNNEFFDYAEHQGFALFRMNADTKMPVGPWRHKGTSTDPTQWATWIKQGYMLGVSACASRLILIDVDVKVGPSVAYEYFAAWCSKLGFERPKPYCHTRSGGWHFAFRCPEGFEAAEHRGWVSIKTSHFRPLADGEKNEEIISVRNRAYCVAPGSTFNGQPYSFYPDAPPPSDLPPGLLKLLKQPVVMVQPGTTSGTSEPTDVMRLVSELDALGEFDVEPDWFKYLGAIKLALGDTEKALEVACEMTHAGKRVERFQSTWDRLITTDDGGTRCRIGSMIFRYEQMTGKKFHVGNKIDWSQAITTFPGSQTLPPAGTPAEHATLPPGAVPMFGEGARQPQIVAPEYSEIEIADRFANDYASTVRYVTTRRSWVYWTGKRWCADETDYVLDMARRHCRSEAGLCASTPGNTVAQARSINSAKTVNAIVKLAGVDQRIASRAVDWDADPWLLGTPEGIVDLRTGILRPAQPDDRITKVTAVAPGGDCPTWLKFLDRATNGDIEMQAYLQRIAGYCLTGDVSEQALFFLDGKGGNGKGVFVNTLQNILKDYAKPTAIETLTASNSDRHPTDIADLLGARLVTCSETERGKRWAESRIKQMTGGDQLSARFTGKDFFAFTPTFKIVVSGNTKPSLRADDAMRRRFQVVPFRVTIPKDEQDKKLADKLKREWAGILAWAVAGAIAWQRDGLKPPASVNDATRDYMDDESEDTLSMWIAERCDTSDPAARTALTELHRSYDTYARTVGERDILSSVRLGKALGELGYQPVRTGRAGRLRVGIKVKSLGAAIASGAGQLPPFPVSMNAPPMQGAR